MMCRCQRVLLLAMRRCEQALLTGLGLPADATPALLAMIPQLDKQATPQGGIGFQGAQYNREHFGPMKFKNLMKWLGQV